MSAIVGQDDAAAHIAALEAERDEARGERDALWERASEAAHCWRKEEARFAACAQELAEARMNLAIAEAETRNATAKVDLDERIAAARAQAFAECEKIISAVGGTIDPTVKDIVDTIRTYAALSARPGVFKTEDGQFDVNNFGPTRPDAEDKS